jgi:hypothetical protein
VYSRRPIDQEVVASRRPFLRILVLVLLIAIALLVVAAIVRTARTTPLSGDVEGRSTPPSVTARGPARYIPPAL